MFDVEEGGSRRRRGVGIGQDMVVRFMSLAFGDIYTGHYLTFYPSPFLGKEQPPAFIPPQFLLLLQPLLPLLPTLSHL